MILTLIWRAQDQTGGPYSHVTYFLMESNSSSNIVLYQFKALIFSHLEISEMGMGYNQ